MNQINSLILVNEAISNHFSTRHCVIAYKKQGVWWIGTGSVVKLGGSTFIASCKHVVDAFFASSETRIVFESGLSFSKDDVEYAASQDKPVDQALITMPSGIGDLQHYSLSDFDLIDDFTTCDFSRTNLFVYGYPIELAKRITNGYAFSNFSFLTLPNDPIPSTKETLVLSYPIGTDQIVSKRRKGLPHPHGMSGALVLAIPYFEEDQLWTPYDAKVIAMQRSWNTADRLYASSIRHLCDLLE